MREKEKKSKLTKEVLAFLSDIGRKGGKAKGEAKVRSKEQYSLMGKLSVEARKKIKKEKEKGKGGKQVKK